MSAFWKMSVIQTKLYLRDPMAVFFTLLFGPLLLVIMGFIFGTTPQPELNGLSQMDVSIPAYSGLIIGITGLTSVPVGFTIKRETGMLRRFSATPLKPLVYFLSDILAPFLVTLAGIFLIVLLGFTVYHVRFSGEWLSVIAGLCLCILSFFSLGYALAGILPNSRVAIVLGNAIIIPMNIFSGALLPIEVMPPAVQSFARLIPMTHMISLLKGLWFGAAWGDHLLEVAVLVGSFIIGVIVVALTFKWE